ncbi:NYN domain-containing protein [Rhodococcus sp. IEGM 1370]|uniref:NYN domain-containing protein n=1 Tax=unclassified Rhodococcus (in: high G+C Gram-positive bacteria) TaxID=192944 RepID=UPI0011F02D51|nr:MULTISPECIES: NYN domain-containing protein [unclassified Rhodococcus (in: high G+C Gram-positive bacteria)]KAA0925821.1 NYN domain-containing protein [Rhodococcus sp. ANT_H53B]MDV8076423.1 NYN domain-containing protein [Rhodococcus sp. IEGM 1370]
MPSTAIFIDLENIVQPAQMPEKARAGDSRLRSVSRATAEGICDFAEGAVAIRRAYAYSNLERSNRALVDAGFRFVPVSGSGTSKNASDIFMATDAMEVLYTKPEISRFVLVTGDSDFSPVLVKLVEHGKSVILIGRSTTRQSMRANATDFIDIQQLATTDRSAPVVVAASQVPVQERVTPDLVAQSDEAPDRDVDLRSELASDLLVRAFNLAVPPGRGSGEGDIRTRSGDLIFKIYKDLADIEGYRVQFKLSEIVALCGDVFQQNAGEISATSLHSLFRQSDNPLLSDLQQKQIATAVRGFANGGDARVNLSEVQPAVTPYIGSRICRQYHLWDLWNLAAYLDLYVDTVEVLRPTSTRAWGITNIDGVRSRVG